MIWLRFVAQLDQRRTRRDQFFRISDDSRDWIRLRGEAREVDDGVKGGELQNGTVLIEFLLQNYSI